MKIRLLLIFSYFMMMSVCGTVVSAQTPAIDSLLSVLASAKEDTNKVLIMVQLSDHLRNSREYSRSLQYDDSSLALSHKLGYKAGVSKAYTSKGRTDLNKSDYAGALKNFQAALKIQEEIGDKKKTAICYKNIAIAYRNLGNYPEATKNHLAALRIREEIGDKNGIADSYHSLGVIYAYQKNYEEALKYYLAALEGFRQTDDKKSMALAYNNLALTYSEMNKHQEALDNFWKALKINEELGIKSLVASNYGNLSYIYGNVGNYEDGLKYARMSIKIYEEIGEDKRAMSSVYINAGFVLTRLAEAEKNEEEARKKYEEAFQYYDTALGWAKESGNKERIKNAYNGLHEMYYRQGNYELALKNYKLYLSYKDSLLNEQSNRQTELLRIQYNTEKKDRELELNEMKMKKQKALLLAAGLEAEKRESDIVLLNANNEVRELQLTEAERKLAQQQAEAKAKAAELEVIKKDKELQEQQLSKQRLLRNGLIAGSLLLILMGVFVFRSIQLRRKLEKQQVVAEERKRISADLHDEIGSALSSINILSGLAGDKLETDRVAAREIIGRINVDAKRTHESMYDIIWEVKPENDSLEKVVTRMRQYASEILEAKNIHLRFPRNEDLKTTEMGAEKRHALYLIFKESINNIAKYSDATEAVVSLSRNNGTLKLSVTDNGRGFDPMREAHGNGITNMKQRSKMTGADFELQSGSGKGTSIALNMPIP